MLYSRSLLVIHFKYSSLYMSIPNSLTVLQFPLEGGLPIHPPASCFWVPGFSYLYRSSPPLCTCCFQTGTSKQWEEEKLRGTGKFLLDWCHPILAPKSQSFGVFFVFCFNWSIVNLQCCVNFCCTAKWFSYTYIYTFLFIFFSIMVYHRILNILCCTVGPCGLLSLKV